MFRRLSSRSRAPVASFFAAAFVLALCAVAAAAQAAPADVAKLKLPPGFRIEVWAADVPDARSLRLGARGTVFVGTRGAGRLYAVVDRGGRREVKVIAQGLRQPNGIEFANGALYVATPRDITRYDDIENRLDDPPRPAMVYDRLPGDSAHGWKFIGLGPDGKLYVPTGAPCNICAIKEGYAQIARMNLDGSGMEVVARGVRNTVGFDWDPKTGELWFTNNGRDWLGDDLPSDTLNRVVHPGRDHFGFPYCHQGDLPDPEFGRGRKCGDYAQPALLLGAHVAALGMRFYGGSMFLAKYRGAIFIARHGSWNRSSKVGADVVAAWPDGRGGARMEPFLSGFLENERYSGRPVDVLELKDGSLLVSDDYAGAIYRISYAAP